MKDMLRYLFKPSTNDREAIRSAYYESVQPTHVTMLITLLAAITFMVMTFVYPAYFGGTTVLYHQICYVWVIAIAVIWLIGAHYAMKDFAKTFDFEAYKKNWWIDANEAKELGLVNFVKVCN